MKQLAMLLVAGFMAVSLAACGGEDKQKQPEAANQETMTQPAQMPEQGNTQANEQTKQGEATDQQAQGAAENQMQE